jgi:hypothetical protein
MPLSGRLLPERTIRPSHVAETETTRHRITSFRFVEHSQMMGSLDRNDKSADENSPSTEIAGTLRRNKAIVAMEAGGHHAPRNGTGR